MQRVFIILALVLFGSSVFASSHYGKLYYKKKLHSVCGIYGFEFAQKHTQDEWDELKAEGRLIQEWEDICPQGKTVFEHMKRKDKKNLFDFVWTYASDSGEIPSCSE
jgi:hypothetical protein